MQGISVLGSPMAWGPLEYLVALPSQQEFPKLVPITMMSQSQVTISSGSGAQGQSEKSPHPFSVLSEQAREDETGAGASGSSLLPWEESSVLYLQRDLERQVLWVGPGE